MYIRTQQNDVRPKFWHLITDYQIQIAYMIIICYNTFLPPDNAMIA